MIGEQHKHDLYEFPISLNDKIELAHEILVSLRLRLWLSGIKGLVGMYAHEDLKTEPKSVWDLDGSDWEEDTDSRSGWWGRPSLGQYTFGCWRGMQGTGAAQWVYSSSGSYPDDGTRGDVIQAYMATTASYGGPFSSSVYPTLYVTPWGPGSVICWFEESFTHECTKIDATNEWFEFTHTTALEEDFRVGTPFRLTATAEDGYYAQHYRVASVNHVSTKLRVTVTKLDDSTFTWLGTDYPTGCGSAICDFGGDWYTLKGWKAWNWLMYPVGGTYDSTLKAKRPPTGGDISADSNTDWIRTINPAEYYHCCPNGHRVVCQNDIQGTTSPTYYSSVIPTDDFLCADSDPKEVRPPTEYVNTGRIAWHYDDKVEIKRDQITELSTATIGAQYAVQEYGQSGVGHSNAKQYSHWSNSGTIWSQADQPVYGSNQHADWKEYAYSSAIQNMLELVAAQQQWAWAVDDVYKLNWITLHATGVPDWGDGTTTYWGYYSASSDVDDAYKPLYDEDQPDYALLTDELWGCNGSAIECMLYLHGEYDWYFDTTYPWVSKRILDLHWEDEDSNGSTIADANHPYPIGTWRRTFKRSMGPVRPGKMMPGSYTPTGQDYEAAGGDEPWIGVWVSTTPTPAYSEYNTGSLTPTQSGDHATFSVSGDHTSDLGIGFSIWDSSGTATVIFASEYTGGNTEVTIKDYTVAGAKTFYTNATLSGRHDGCGIESSESSYYDDVLWIFQDVHELFEYLKYQMTEISIALSKWLKYADTAVLYSSEYAAIAGYLEEIEDDRPAINSTSGWSSGTGLVGFYGDHRAVWNNTVNDWFWNAFTPPAYTEALFKITDGAEDFAHMQKAFSSISVRLKWKAGSNAAIGGELWDYATLPDGMFAPTLITNTGLTLTAETGSDRKFVYGYVDVNFATDADDVLYLHCKLGNVPVPFDRNITGLPTIETIFFTIEGLATLVTDQNQILMEIDFDKYAEELFRRDTTYRNIEPEDPTTDTKPPIPTTSKWWQVPIVYDANYETGIKAYDTDEMYEEDSTYGPEWRIKCESYPSEDLGSPPVTYVLTHDNGSGSADYNDTNDTAEFDFKIGTNGDNDDLASAFADDMLNWTFEISVKDSVSPTANETTSTSSEELVSDEADTLIGRQAVFSTEPTRAGSAPYTVDMECISFSDDRTDTIYYQFTLHPGGGGSDIVSSWQTSTTFEYTYDGSPAYHAEDAFTCQAGIGSSPTIKNEISDEITVTI